MGRSHIGRQFQPSLASQAREMLRLAAAKVAQSRKSWLGNDRSCWVLALACKTTPKKHGTRNLTWVFTSFTTPINWKNSLLQKAVVFTPESLRDAFGPASLRHNSYWVTLKRKSPFIYVVSLATLGRGKKLRAFCFLWKAVFRYKYKMKPPFSASMLNTRLQTKNSHKAYFSDTHKLKSWCQCCRCSILALYFSHWGAPVQVQITLILKCLFSLAVGNHNIVN